MTGVDEAMSQYAHGRSDAFEIVYDEVAPRLERYLRKHLRSTSMVEDIIQQTFLQMHAARGTFIVGAAVMPWAFAIAQRVMVDFIRKVSRESYVEGAEGSATDGAGTSVAAPHGNGEDLLSAQQTRLRILAAYRTLSEPQRAAYDLVATEGLSHAEAACVLGTTVTGIKLRIHRAYLALRASVSEELPSRAALPTRGGKP